METRTDAMARIRAIIQEYDRRGWDWLLVVEAAARYANHDAPIEVLEDALNHNREIIN